MWTFFHNEHTFRLSILGQYQEKWLNNFRGMKLGENHIAGQHFYRLNCKVLADLRAKIKMQHLGCRLVLWQWCALFYFLKIICPSLEKLHSFGKIIVYPCSVQSSVHMMGKCVRIHMQISLYQECWIRKFASELLFFIFKAVVWLNTEIESNEFSSFFSFFFSFSLSIHKNAEEVAPVRIYGQLLF